MNTPNDDWNWFREMLVPLRASAREGVHPSRALLHAYIRGRRLRDLWRVGARLLDPDDWTLTEVSQHILTCPACAQQVALLRRRELERATPWRELWEGLPGAIRTHVAVYALALFVLFVLNALVMTLVPAPTVLLPCAYGAEPAQPVNPHTADRNLKTEGLNKPVKVPPSLSEGQCVPVPAPRPPWQTWWVGWVFLLWTILLGLHALWDWLTGPEPRRTVTASTVLRSVGFAPVFV